MPVRQHAGLNGSTNTGSRYDTSLSRNAEEAEQARLLTDGGAACGGWQTGVPAQPLDSSVHSRKETFRSRGENGCIAEKVADASPVCTVSSRTGRSNTDTWPQTVPHSCNHPIMVDRLMLARVQQVKEVCREPIHGSRLLRPSWSWLKRP